MMMIFVEMRVVVVEMKLVAVEMKLEWLVEALLVLNFSQQKFFVEVESR